jgi:precorrin-6Y C5,15-methyltransferase (decarboxylating)
VVALAFPVAVVGVGPGSREYLLPVAREAVLAAEVLVGGHNALALFDSPGKEQRLIGRDLDGILEYIDDARQTKRVAVLLSGDPGFYSLLPRLRQRFGAGGIIVIPGISSLQLACARLGIKWDDLAVASVHGRGLDGLAEIAGAERAAVLTEPRYPPAAVCRHLLEQGSRFRQAWVLTDLGLPGEGIAYGSLEETAGQQRVPFGRGNSILILLKDELDPGQLWGVETPHNFSIVIPGKHPETPPAPKMGQAVGEAALDTGHDTGHDAATTVAGLNASLGKATWDLDDRSSSAAREAPDLGAYLDVVTPGLPDKLFVQGAAAMSQEEVRALTLCKARLKRGMVVYEIGAGTGSWTVEAARLVAPGAVWAVEKNPAAAALVRANLQQFGIANVNLAEGDAPEACRGWPPADCILIGGSGGRLREILVAAGNWLRPGGRVVITAVTPETFSGAWQALQDEPWTEMETVLVNLARVALRGSAQIWSGENPVFILSARLAGGIQQVLGFGGGLPSPTEAYQ